LKLVFETVSVAQNSLSLQGAIAVIWDSSRRKRPGI